MRYYDDNIAEHRHHRKHSKSLYLREILRRTQRQLANEQIVRRCGLVSYVNSGFELENVLLGTYKL